MAVQAVSATSNKAQPPKTDTDASKKFEQSVAKANTKPQATSSAAGAASASAGGGKAPAANASGSGAASASANGGKAPAANASGSGAGAASANGGKAPAANASGSGAASASANGGKAPAANASGSGAGAASANGGKAPAANAAGSGAASANGGKAPAANAAGSGAASANGGKAPAANASGSGAGAASANGGKAPAANAAGSGAGAASANGGKAPAASASGSGAASALANGGKAPAASAAGSTSTASGSVDGATSPGLHGSGSLLDRRDPWKPQGGTRDGQALYYAKQWFDKVAKAFVTLGQLRTGGIVEMFKNGGVHVVVDGMKFTIDQLHDIYKNGPPTSGRNSFFAKSNSYYVFSVYSQSVAFLEGFRTPWQQKAFNEIWYNGHNRGYYVLGKYFDRENPFGHTNPPSPEYNPDNSRMVPPRQ